ncbi:MAG: ECF transporter S component [Butyricicoccus sp.]
MKQKNQTIQNLVLSAMFLALGIVLPFFTGQIPQIGSMLLPMHLPVLLCGLICGWQYGGLIGFLLPPLRYVLFGMPPIFPSGIAMAFEMAAYGVIAGFLYRRSRWQCVIALYRSLIAAMIGGRLVWGTVRALLSGVASQAFTWQMFLSGAFLTALPGIVLQLVFIPALMVALDRTGMVHFHREKSSVRTARQ